MFAGGRRRSSGNIRAMQLFHELKQQFPTIPDHIVSAYIANHANKSSSTDRHRLQDVLDAGSSQEELMGRTPPEPTEPALPLPEPSCNKHQTKQFETKDQNTTEQQPDRTTATTERSRSDMNESESDINRNVVKPSAFYSKGSETVEVSAGEGNVAQKEGNSSFFVKRPNSLNIKNVVGDFNQCGSSTDGRQIQPSGRCSDIHKLLNSENVNNKPPRSPLSCTKRFGNVGAKQSPTKCERSPLTSPEVSRRLSNAEATPSTSNGNIKKTEQKRETVETPTQTTDTLLGKNFYFFIHFNLYII